MIYIPFLYFSFLFIFMLLKQKSFNLGSFIVLIYIISSFFSILIKKYDLLNYNFPVIKLEPTFLYCFLLTISILPFYKYRSEKIGTEFQIMITKGESGGNQENQPQSASGTVSNMYSIWEVMKDAAKVISL